MTAREMPRDRGLRSGAIGLRTWRGRRAPFYLLPGLDVEISASEIREAIRKRAGSAERGLRTPAVEAYVRMHGLYCEGS